MKKPFKKAASPFVYPVYYLKLQKCWADGMSRITHGLSKTQLIILLTGFAVLTAGCLIYNICRAVSSEDPLLTNTAGISQTVSINSKK